jgi:nucleoside-diphosphate-sugar epimerase
MISSLKKILLGLFIISKNAKLEQNMSTIVTVTGATGFLASHIVKFLLERNYIVHGTVRSLANRSKYQFLQEFPNAKQNLKLFEADNLKEGSFDEAVQHSNIVLHTASPFFLKQTNNPQRDLVDPAVNGTLNILNSAQKIKNIRRVVITASVATIYSPLQVTSKKVFNEDDWNTSATLKNLSYMFSKVQAEKAAWKYLQENKPHYDIVTIHPPFILGSNYNNPSRNDLNESNSVMLNNLLKLKRGEALSTVGAGFVHVDDVAELHIRAGLSNDPKVSNKRFIISSGEYTFPEIARIAIKEFPEEFSEANLKINGDEKEGKEKTVHFDTSRFRETFPDFKLKPIEKIVRDTINNFKELKLL